MLFSRSRTNPVVAQPGLRDASDSVPPLSATSKPATPRRAPAALLAMAAVGLCAIAGAAA